MTQSGKDESGIPPTPNIRPKLWHIGVVLVLYFFIVLVLALLLRYSYINPGGAASATARLTARKDLLQAVAVLAAGGVALVGAYVTWMTLRHSQQSTRETLEVSERGQITEPLRKP